MKITLDITESEAILLRDTLIDKSLSLRTRPNDTLINEDDFMTNPDISERRKANYWALRDMAQIVASKIK